MKKLILSLLLLATITARAEVTWLTDLDAAKAKGLKENKPVLVDFTGSDWCPPCIQLHKVVFGSAEFAAVATKYVLVELDYPRNKPQSAEVKAKNREWQQKYAVNSFPTILLLDAKSGEVFGRVGGFGGQTAKEYLDKLASFKNTPEGKAALEQQEQKSTAGRSAKSREIGQKIDAAIKAKDFKAAESALDEFFGGGEGPDKAVLPFKKARVLIMIDPTAKEQALKYIDEAIALTAGDETLGKPFKAFREKIASGATATPKAPAGAK